MSVIVTSVFNIGGFLVTTFKRLTKKKSIFIIDVFEADKSSLTGFRKINSERKRKHKIRVNKEVTSKNVRSLHNMRKKSIVLKL